MSDDVDMCRNMTSRRGIYHWSTATSMKNSSIIADSVLVMVHSVRQNYFYRTVETATQYMLYASPVGSIRAAALRRE